MEREISCVCKAEFLQNLDKLMKIFFGGGGWNVRLCTVIHFCHLLLLFIINLIGGDY
jgi:hypothetical protein